MKNIDSWIRFGWKVPFKLLKKQKRTLMECSTRNPKSHAFGHRQKLVQHRIEEHRNFVPIDRSTCDNDDSRRCTSKMKLKCNNLHLAELQNSPSLLGLSNGHDDSLLIAALVNDLIGKGYAFGTY